MFAAGREANASALAADALGFRQAGGLIRNESLPHINWKPWRTKKWMFVWAMMMLLCSYEQGVESVTEGRVNVLKEAMRRAQQEALWWAACICPSHDIESKFSS